MDSKKLYQKSVELTAELRNTLDKWEADKGTGQSEYKERAAKIEADLDALDVQIRQAKRVEENEKDLNTPTFDTRGLSTGHMGDAVGNWERRFIKAIKDGNNAELREMAVGSAGGAAAVPNNFDELIRKKMYANNVIRGISKVTQVNGQKKITIEDALPTTELVAESTAMSSPSDPTFGSLVQVFPYMFKTKAVVTNEFLADALSGTSGVGNVLSYITDRIGLSQGRAHENYFANGTGSSQPQGVGVGDLANAGQVEVTVGTAISAITADNLIDTFFALAPQYRANASWVMSDALLKTVRKLKDDTGRYIFQLDGSMTEAPNGTLLGRPVFISPYWNTAVTADKVYATIGDFQFFEIFDRQGTEVLVDPYVNASESLTNVYATTRMDSKVIHGEAFSQLLCDDA